MGIVRKSIPPPDVKEGDVLKAAIKEIEYPVKSKFEDDQGNPQYQVRFRVQFDNGYECPIWMRYYERPSDRSKHGQLILTLQRLYNKVYETNEEAFNDLKRHGRLYVRCRGFRERNEMLYPKFEVVATRLPPRQTEITETKTEETETASSSKKPVSIEEIRKMTEGWPEERIKEYIELLRETGRLKENL